MVLSSTYLYIGAGVVRSLMYMITFRGPETVPCGTPPLGLPIDDVCFPIFTRCVLANRKLAIHRIICGGTPFASSLASNISWLIKSNAFEKSNAMILT